MPPLEPITSGSRPALGRGVRMRPDPLSGESLLLYPEGVLPLDESTHEILSRCDGKATIAEISEALSQEYDCEAEAIASDIVECLSHLRGEMLICC